MSDEKEVPVDLDKITLDPETDEYQNTAENLTLMFRYLKQNKELLEQHQQDFIASVGGQFVARGRISEKQFKYVVRYFAMVQIDLSGGYPEFDGDYIDYMGWHDGDPANYGDN